MSAADSASPAPFIAVLDYGIGNLRSAEKALQRVGGAARLVTEPDEVAGAAGVVLPGVGAFGACARALRASGLDGPARRAVEQGVPFLGVCVGFQLLFEASEEDPGASGLGLIEGVVTRLEGAVKLPQMQWNQIYVVDGRRSAMFDEMDAPWFYFVHSYAPTPSGSGRAAVVATCSYGGEVVAAVERGALWGTQFHPEKSGHCGLELLRRFVATCSNTRGGP